MQRAAPDAQPTSHALALVVNVVKAGNPRLEAAFAAVSRERFLGPGPWQIMRNGRYVLTPDADPISVYDDVLIGIVPERGLNNGMPSHHALVLASADIRKGEHAVHVGAGTGYYTAIAAHLVGSSGSVTAIEYDSSLATRARETWLHSAM